MDAKFKLIKLSILLVLGLPIQVFSANIDIARTPVFVSDAVPPLNMLVMGKDHKLYYEAYNDASDLNGDGVLDVGYKPSINYYGYYNSNICYTHSSGVFTPSALANNKRCSGAWSGDFLNYLTTSRMDALRKVLYGGYRVVDTNTSTILQGAYIPRDAHSWGKEYTSRTVNGYNISDYAPLSTPTTGRRHLFAVASLNDNSVPSLRVLLNSSFRIWEWVSRESPVAFNLCGAGTTGTNCGTIVDYDLKVRVCPDNISFHEANCKIYANGKYKPTGILHDYGETNRMYFGLLSGSYVNNLQGGVLRKNIGRFAQEINPTTGQFCLNGNCGADVKGIVDTINRFRIIDYTPGGAYSCGWIAATSINNGQCEMWGNPIAEMMYETLRYFAGASSPTASFDYSSGSDVTKLNLPKPSWRPPYAANGGNYPVCSAPVMTVISDINPSYEETLPGSNWGGLSNASDPNSIRSLNVSSELDAIGTAEDIHGGRYFIGEANGVVDGAPTGKIINNLSRARGLAPDEPTKLGTFYSAAVARYGARHNINDHASLRTYAVALASPLPKFTFPVGSRKISFVPFAKSVRNYGINSTGNFQPTNQIVDFYVQNIANTDPNGSDRNLTINQGRPYAEFRINYEDVEQGADHDMDAIALYTLQVTANNRLSITLNSEYASGSIVQSIGYIISGTTSDGVYLEIRDDDTDRSCTRLPCPTDITYKFNTPANRNAGYCLTITPANTNECRNLPLTASRTFTPASTVAAGLLKDPLWYAAKYGLTEPEFNANGDPRNYFLVTNALTLKDQLDKAFSDITQRNSSVSTPAVQRMPQGTSVSAERSLYRTEFFVDDWSGDLVKERFEPTTGQRTLLWRAKDNIPNQNRNIKFKGASGLTDLSYTNLAGLSYGNIALQSSITEAQLNYVLGSRSGEGQSFRRRSSLLGDIVNSNPVVVAGAQYLAYQAGSIDGDYQTYVNFIEAQKTRRAQIYIGSNDGMLHAFDADSGIEKFAFVPTSVIPSLKYLSDPNYKGSEHRWYVDGSLTVRDVYFDSAWHTVLIGTLGAGGKSVFALDVTNPDQISLLWELTDADSSTWDSTNTRLSNLGYSIPTPVVARLHTGVWGVLLANGYNSANSESGKAVMFVLDIKTGEIISTLKAQGSASNNGLSSIRGADNNSDGIIDYAYAGDLQGNLWRFDLLDTSSTAPFSRTNIQASALKVSFNGNPLYTATDGNNRQPITAPPSLVRHPSQNGYIIIFGSGRYLGVSDKTSPYKLDSLYGIWDKQTKGQPAASTPSLTRANLQAQSINQQTQNNFGNGAMDIRLISQNSVDWSTKSGWYLDLSINNTLAGERIVDSMFARGQVLLFNTRTPNLDPCQAGVDGWTYGIDPFTGGKTNFNVFDLSKNYVIDSNDALLSDNIRKVISGYKAPAGGTALSNDRLFNPDGSETMVNFGPEATARQSWWNIPNQ